MKTMILEGREYKVEEFLDRYEQKQYRLIGKRGAKYFTIRNRRSPELMFLVREGRKLGQNSITNWWVTDRNGTLEEAKVVQSRRWN